MKKIVGIFVCMLLIATVLSVSGTVIVERTFKSTSSGNTLYVGGSGPSNYTSIQEAINDSSDGDTVFVYDDSSPYYENIEVYKSINLIGENRNTTIIDGSGSGDVVNITVDLVNISGFTIHHSEHGTGYDAGINLASNYCTIIGNIIFNNDWCIDVRFSGYNTIADNIISLTNGGIHLAFSFNNTITDNTISNNYSGIHLHFSNGNTISDNMFFNGGLSVIDSYHNTVSENTVNGKPLVYLEDESDKTIDGGAGQIIIVKCEGITIQNQVLSGTNIGLHVCDSNECYISGCIISDNHQGVAIGDSNNVIFMNNTISQNTYCGVGIYRDNGGTEISNNKISNNGEGMYIFNCRNGVSIFNNSISSNNLGIDISSGSSDCVVSGNEISNNNKGIELRFSSKNKISFNNFLNNEQNAFFSFFRSDFKYNNWNRNYWNCSRLLPKPIFGQMEIWFYRFSVPRKITLPWLAFDWRPAQEPYDIGV